MSTDDDNDAADDPTDDAGAMTISDFRPGELKIKTL